MSKISNIPGVLTHFHNFDIVYLDQLSIVYTTSRSPQVILPNVILLDDQCSCVSVPSESMRWLLMITALAFGLWSYLPSYLVSVPIRKVWTVLRNIFTVLTVVSFCLSAEINVCKVWTVTLYLRNSRLEPTYGRFLRHFEGLCHVWTETKSTFFIFNPVLVKIHEGLLSYIDSYAFVWRCTR